MISDPDNIYIIDERATRRARRIVAALNDLEARGKSGEKRYAKLKAELDGLAIRNTKRKSGASISVPRI